MANEITDIGDLVKKCKILLLDIEGTTTSISFVKDKLFPYAEENVKSFLESQWETNDVKETVTALRKLALEDEKKNLEGVVAIPGEDASKEEQIEGLVKNVKWQMSSDRKAGPLKHLQGLIWKQAFDKGEIKGHVYDDVSAALEQWHGVEGQKIYIYSSGSVQAQKLLFEKSLAGDLLPYIDGHFDTSIGPKHEIDSYSSIVEKIGCEAEEVLFLTDIQKEAEVARYAGMYSALVSREGNAPLTKDATENFAVIHSFTQLAVSNKRKTDPQDEQPAKIPKTDNSNDVTKSDIKTTQNKAKEVSEEMEVEEDNTLPKEGNTEEKKITEEPAAIVEDITDSNPTDVPISSVEPIITEICEKQETEKMETDTIEAVETAKKETEQEKTSEHAKTDASDKSEVEKNIEKEAVDVPKQNLEEILVDQKAPIAEVTSPDVITEIEEITGDKENLIELGDKVNDVKPVVEEPASEILELQNAGKELEKECVDILNKVQSVTNLDNIPLKQQLNPIIEETMESDNEPVLLETVLEKEIEQETTQSIETADSDKLNSKIKKEKVKIGKEKAEAAELDIAQDISASEKDDTESVGDKTECTKNSTETDKEKIESVEDKSKSSMDTSETPESKTEISEQKSESKDDSTSEQNLKTDSDKNESTEDKKDTDQPMESSDDKIESVKNDKESQKDVSESTKEKQETVDKEKIEISKDNDNTENLEKTSPSVATTTEEKIGESKDKQEEVPVRPPAESSSKDTDAMDTDKVENSTTESTDIPKEEKGDDKIKTKEDKTDEDKQIENSDNSQVNGKTNGETEAVTQNGDASNSDLSSRLSVENGKEVNGSNGNSMDAENCPEEQKDDKKDAEIKVKTVSTDEPRTEPVEQPTEA